MKKLLYFCGAAVVTLLATCSVVSCGPSQEEIARQDSIRVAENQRIADSIKTADSIAKAQEEARLAEEKAQRLAEEESFIKNELAKFVKNDRVNPNVVLSHKAQEELAESTWPEIYCENSGYLDAVGPNVVVKKIGNDTYRYQCKCTCGSETYVDNWSIHAVYDDGKVKITSFGSIN